MGLNHSPKIVTSGLAFAYDMGNTQKSWKGAPVTNLVPNPYAGWNGSSFVLSYNGDTPGGQTFTYVTNVSNPIGAPGVLQYTTGTAGYKYWAIASTIATTGTHTFSYYARIVNGPVITSNLSNAQLWRSNGVDQAVTGDWNPTYTTEWVKYSTTGPCTAGTVLDYFPIHSGVLAGGYTIQYCGFQLELGTYATPFAVGTRSSTQALLDLTRDNTITVTSLTYNSNNTFSFNNIANSTFNIPDSTLIRPPSVTISAWVNLTAFNPLNDFDGQFPTIAWKGYDGQAGTQASYALTLVTGAFPRLTIAPSTLVSTVALPTNTWVNIVGTYTAGGAMVLYRNGEVDTTGTGPAAISYAAQVFGIGTRTFSGANQYPWNGSISLVQLYNRALTAAEVQQNFNALRGRYGI